MSNQQLSVRRLTGLLLGPALFVLILVSSPPEGLSIDAYRVAGVALLMAVWWITEAIPIPATALLPIVLFPVLGVVKASEVTSAYANHLIYLFMGGFLIAVTMERWDLHKRIALHTIRLVGVSPKKVVFGFMLATAFLSMWISNTATTMMMVPIGIAVITQASSLLKKSGDHSPERALGQFNFGTALMLGIAYAASIGGVATLIGTPPNAILAGVVESTYGVEISFTQWFSIGLPLASVFLVIAWVFLTKVAFPIKISSLPGGKEIISTQIHQLGAMSTPERRVLVVFLLVASAWILRGIFRPEMLASIGDSTIAIAGALLLFVIPADWKKGVFLLNWETAVKIPWDIMVLFGGGFALANGFNQSGLTDWIANQIVFLNGLPIIVVVGSVALLVVFLTEVTSNTATASLFVPVMGAVAVAIEMHPLGLMVTATIAASYAFMLPVATPPNAIVFGSRQISIRQMARAGFWLNIVAVILISVVVVFLLPEVWGLDLTGHL